MIIDAVLAVVGLLACTYCAHNGYVGPAVLCGGASILSMFLSFCSNRRLG